MLQSFRVIINSFVGKVFFGLLILTFGLVGVGYGIRDLLLGATTSNDAASIGGAKISLQAYDREYRRQIITYQRQYGAGFNPTPQQRRDIARDTLDHEVTETLFAKAASRAGMVVDDRLVRKIIEAEPAFAGEDKKFDAAHFKMLLEGQGLTEAGFVDSARRNLTRQLVTNPIGASAVIPRAMAEDLYRYRNEQRVAQTITLANAAATGVTTPSDGEIKAYYDNHQVAFTAPEYRSFTVLSLTPDLFAGEITPSDDDVRAAYESRKSEYVVAEQRKIDQVVLNDQATAEAVAKAAVGGKSLADAAKAATGGKAQPVSLPMFPRDQYPEALQGPVFAAAKDTITGPVETPLGWHVFLVNEIIPGKEVPLEQVKDKLVAALKHDGAVDRLSDQIDKIGDKLSGGAPMDQVAAGLRATPVKFVSLDAKGEPPTAGAKPAAPPDPGWVEAAFALRPGETSAMQTGKEGSYFAVRLDDITPPALRPLADVRADIAIAWTNEQKANQTAKKAEALTAQAKAGTPFDQVAAKAGLKVDTSATVTREANDKSSLPIPVVEALFQMTKLGDIQTVDSGDGQIIVRLSEIHPADPYTAGDKVAALMHEFDAGLQADVLTQYRAALEQAIPVKINPRAVETVAQ